MTNILDTVEPDAYRYNKVRGMNKEPFGTEYSEAPPRQNPGLTEQCSSVDQLYSRETVEPAIERLLAEHRKQVLLEAAGAVDIACKNGDLPDCCEDAADYIARMAEGEK